MELDFKVKFIVRILETFLVFLVRISLESDEK
jgi:hypothetical protein